MLQQSREEAAMAQLKQGQPPQQLTSSHFCAHGRQQGPKQKNRLADEPDGGGIKKWSQADSNR
jgi:hypothetical protein